MNKPTSKTTTHKTHHKALGNFGEQRAQEAVQEKGWALVASNWRYSRLGELDIVAYDSTAACLHIIEVKTRHRANARSTGLAIESITEAKQAQIRQLAELFLSHWAETPELNAQGDINHVSLDVITIEPNLSPETQSDPWQLTWHENAF